jgi:hypothetical protein
MKNHLSLGIIIVLTVFVQSCAPSTAVRVLSLSYESQLEAQPLNNPEKLTNRFNGPKRVDDEETYIFPGDILTFTVELEDPNYEFISLLAIKFNGQTIRANSDDSIVTTRDCGSNICADFPFEIQAEVSEYVVQEVKFAKLNADSGINAIIDNESMNQLNLNVWSSLASPYIESSLLVINNFLDKLEFYNLEQAKNITPEQFQTFIFSRTLSILNPTNSPSFNFVSPGGIESYQLPIFANLINANGIDIEQSIFITLGPISTNSWIINTGIFGFYLLLEEFNNYRAINEGNIIYLTDGTNSYQLIELFQRTRITELVVEYF